MPEDNLGNTRMNLNLWSLLLLMSRRVKRITVLGISQSLAPEMIPETNDAKYFMLTYRTVKAPLGGTPLWSLSAGSVRTMHFFFPLLSSSKDSYLS